jgi:hypothetical protein
MLGKIEIFRGESFEKSFSQEIPRNFPRKITFCEKKVRKIDPSRKIGTWFLYASGELSMLASLDMSDSFGLEERRRRFR